MTIVEQDTHVCRSELRLARPAVEPLRDVPLNPDPLSVFARAAEEARWDKGERVKVQVALLAPSPMRRRRLVRRMQRQGSSNGNGQGGAGKFLHELAQEFGIDNGQRPAAQKRDPVDVVEQRRDLQEPAAKLLDRQQLFETQILIRTEARSRERAEGLMRAMLAAFEIFARANHLRVSGVNLGVAFLGSDGRLRRGWFDKRMETRYFRPASKRGGNIVTASEIAGLLKPFTARCPEDSVIRGGAFMPAAPHDLPIYRGRPGVLPLGLVPGRDGTRRMVGMSTTETKFGLMAGRQGQGKALALDTPIPTPDGWTTMGALRVGDVIFDEGGARCRVTAATDVMHGHRCYDVVFSDGTTITADGEHRWSTWGVYARKAATVEAGARIASTRSTISASGHRGVVALPSGRFVARSEAGGRARQLGTIAVAAEFRRRHASPARAVPRIVTTEDIRASLRSGARGDHAANHAIPTCGPLKYGAKNLPVDPYVLGCWLGDGTTRHGSGFSCAEPELVDHIRACGYEVRKRASKDGWGIIGLHAALFRLGVINDKHIPDVYLRSSPEQRIALLQGLMDTDGWAGVDVKAGGMEFCVTCRRLAEDVYELLCGLGVRVRWTSSPAMLKDKHCGTRYRLRFSPSFPVFRLTRKLARQRLDPKMRFRYIVDVRPVDSVPVRCIAVDSPSHLYLASRACIPTHNTNEALAQFLHVALNERDGTMPGGEPCAWRGVHGGIYFDPHVDACAKAKPYLAGPGVRDRVIELNLASSSMQAHHLQWNLLSTQGLTLETLASRMYAVVDSFAPVAGWTRKTATRTYPMFSQAVNALLHIGLQLPDELQPTIFTIPTLLTDDKFRDAVVARLPEHLRGYWTTTFAGFGPEASGPICQLVSDLLANPTVRATFGAPVSTFSPRRAMDEGKIVLITPPAKGAVLECNLIMQGLIDAARSRADIPEALRRWVWAWVDEAQMVDVEAVRGSVISEILREARKYGLRCFVMTQDPATLSDSTRAALWTNASSLMTFATSPQGAETLGKQWGGVDGRTGINARSAVQRLPAYTAIVQPTHRGQRRDPFRMQSVPFEELHAEHHHPDDLEELEAAINRNGRPSTVEQTLKAIEGHDARILAFLQGGGGAGGSGGRPASPKPAPSEGGGGTVVPFRPSRDPSLFDGDGSK